LSPLPLTRHSLTIFQTCRILNGVDNQGVNEEKNKHSTISKAFEIDRAAINIFEGWLPKFWLPRKQDPDVFVDYLVEIVENGEPTGIHFAAQVKGFEETSDGQKPLKYSFETKHLKYYLHRSQHPVVLFLINITTGEGYWFFAQKFLTEKVDSKILDSQDSLTIHFSIEDSLFNSTKFKCLLPEAEEFVRDLHPGSVKAALQKRKAELETIDPRCTVSILVENGKEHVTVTANEQFSFTTRIRSQNEDDWQQLFERGAKMKVRREDIEFTDAPLLSEAVKNAEGDFEIQYGKETPGSIHIISKIEPGKVIPIEGRFRSGTKFFNFQGKLPDSPLLISFEVALEAALKAECFNISILFLPKNWTGQPILSLAYFDQITSFANAFSGTPCPEMEVFFQGNSAVKGAFGSEEAEMAQGITQILEWFRKCRWLAEYFGVNPIFPTLDKLSRKNMNGLEQLHDLLAKQGITVSSPRIKIDFFTDKIVTKEIIASCDKNLRIEKPEQTFDFFGTPVRLGPIRHVFTEMEFFSQTQLDAKTVKVTLVGTEKATRTSSLI
jgi:hypothetical protein